MASVSKLVLIPINTWHRLSKDRKDIDVQSMKIIEISSANQSGTGNVPPPPDPLARLEGPLVGAGSLPLPTPQGGGRWEGGKEEGGTPKYIDREDTCKEKTLIEIERDAGVWRPPGKVISNKKSAIKCKWIHI